MNKSLTPRGNGWALIIPQDIIKICGFNPATVILKCEYKHKTFYLSETKTDSQQNKNEFIRKFSKKGSSWLLYMSASMLGLLDVNPDNDDMIDLDVDGKTLILKKAI